MAVRFGNMNFNTPEQALQYYSNLVQQYAPKVQAPQSADWRTLVEGVKPVLQQEERRAQQSAASQFAKLGMPVSSSYMERLGRIGGETSAKLADITNRYAFQAQQQQAQTELQAALANQRAQMDLLNQGFGGVLAELFRGDQREQTRQAIDSVAAQCQAAFANNPDKIAMCMQSKLGGVDPLAERQLALQEKLGLGGLDLQKELLGFQKEQFGKQFESQEKQRQFQNQMSYCQQLVDLIGFNPGSPQYDQAFRNCMGGQWGGF